MSRISSSNHWSLIPTLTAVAILITATGCKERAPAAPLKLVTGKVVAPELTEFNATVLLNLNDSPCTGQHIGNGYIITAAHCFIIAGAGHDPFIRVTDFQGQDIVSLRPSEYKKLLPPVTSTSRMLSAGKTYEIPIPDLLIFRPTDSAKANKIAALNRYKLSKVAQEKGQSERFVAGYGLVDYDSFDIDGKLRIGAAGISDVSESGYATFWNREGQWAGGAPGDSGGPLFSVDGVELVLHGVASNIQRKKDDSGQTIKVWTTYGRLDTTLVSDWITRETGIAYGSGGDSTDVTPPSPPNRPNPEPNPGLNPVNPAGPGNQDQFVGVYNCKSPTDAAPYWTVDLNFNDPVFAKIKESRFINARSSVSPVVNEWRTDMIVDYGPVMVITNQTGGRIAFYETENRIEKMAERGTVVAKLACIKSRR